MILSWLEFSQLQALCKRKDTYLSDAMQMLQAVDNVCNCHLFVTAQRRDTVFLCAATEDRVVILKWNHSTRKFCFLKVCSKMTSSVDDNPKVLYPNFIGVFSCLGGYRV